MEFCSHLEIDLQIIKNNTARVVDICHKQDVEVLGVTKGFSALPEIVRAMLAGGIDGLADARMENIMDIREEGISAPITLLRIPRLSAVEQVIRYCDVSVNSETKVIEALGQAAMKYGQVHDILLMVDVGDLREGVLYEHAFRSIAEVLPIEGIRLLGIGTNMGCYGGILPEEENLQSLVDLADKIENKLRYNLPILSGGGTSSLLLAEKGILPAGINQLRIGEGILLGTDTTHNREIDWLQKNAFVLHSEIIEIKEKPSIPIGTIGRDAFGNVPQFEDLGQRQRAIIALGRQDVYVEGLIPLEPGTNVLGASSDHLILDITDSERQLHVGDEVAFGLNYSGLLSASQSRYIRKDFKNGG